MLQKNLLGFDMALGRQKPHNINDKKSYCPFCDVASLRNILATEDDIILLKNKYNVIDKTDQLVLIEGRDCDSDMPEYSDEKMHRLMRFAIGHWLKMIKSGKYKYVLFFKNYGPMSGGTIRHPHMQLVGCYDVNPDYIFSSEDFKGITIDEKNHVRFLASAAPRVGFGELNIVPDRLDGVAIDQLANYLKCGTDFLSHHFGRQDNLSYNIFFYYKFNDKNKVAEDCKRTDDYKGSGGHSCGDGYKPADDCRYDNPQIYVKLMPRFPTSPLFVGYNISFIPSNIQSMADTIRKMYFAK